MSDSRASLALFFTPGLGPVRVKALIDHFGSAARALEANLTNLREVPGLDASSVANIGSKAALERADTELERVVKLGLHIIGLGDSSYPESLHAIYDPPPALWVRGDVAALEALTGALPRSIGIVGTRRCSPHAKAFTARLARDLAEVGVTVVSGLARGIDTAAHTAAVDAGGSSIGVLGCGADTIYPSENKALAERLTVVSAYPIGTPPASHNFPARNRIIAGLSSGSVVVEGDVKSGSMITATAALEAGREVFAVPGRPNDPLAQGPHKLIREGATLIESALDVLEALRWNAKPSAPAPILDGDEARVFEALQGEVIMDDLAVSTGLPVPRVMVALTMLSLKNVVLELPGGRFSRA
jgi:DNA processing protein